MTASRRRPPSARSKLPWLWIVAAAFVVVAGLVQVLRRGPGVPGSGSGDLLKAQPKDFAVPAPDAAVFKEYAGSASCVTCHTEEAKLWSESHHGLAERPMDPARDQIAFAFADPIVHGAQTSAVQRLGNQFQIVTLGAEGTVRPHTAERVIGHAPLRQFLVPAAGGRYQVTELAYDPAEHEWFDIFGHEDRRPGEWGHWTGRGMTWNQMCASCHNTRLRKHYDPATDSYGTTMAERAVGCEACHGPMADHVAWQKRYGGEQRLELSRALRPSAEAKEPSSAPATHAVVQTNVLHANKNGHPRDPTIRRLTREQMLSACGSCHARRGELTGEFQPGDLFSDHYQLTIPDESDLYYADGQVRDENYEYTSFLSSRMFAARVSCSDCHEPHSANLRALDNSLCQRCHGPPIAPAPKIDALTHSHHAPGTRGDACVDCHMPLTTYMQRHPRRDHGFTIPDPLLTQEHGIPNACNRCHTDRDAAWALAHVETWYGEKMQRAGRQRAIAVSKARKGEREAAADLARLAREEKIGLWRATATRLLEAWAHDANVKSALLERVGDADPLVRSEAVHALSPLTVTGDAQARNSLEFLLKDPVRAVRVEAAWALRAGLETNSPAGRELLHSLVFNSDQPGGAARLAVFHMDRGALETAVGYWRRAVEWDPNSAPLRDGYAVCLSLLSRPDDALRELSEACRLEPKDAVYRYKLGLALNEVRKLPEAVAALQEAVKLDPQLADAWYNLGLGYAALEQLEDAAAALIRAESIDTRSARIPYARATVLARLGRVEPARLAAQRALELDPNHGEAQQLMQQLR